MPKSRIILAIGFFIALLPFLGFPHTWESFFEIVGGLGIVGLSLAISIDKRLSMKAKAERRLASRRQRLRREADMQEVADVVPEQSHEETPIQQ